MATIRKAALIEQISQRTRIPATVVARVLDAALDEIGTALARGDEVALARFGTFGLRHFPARMGVHPRTGEPMEYPERYAPSFRASLVLKRRVRGEE